MATQEICVFSHARRFALEKIRIRKKPFARLWRIIFWGISLPGPAKDQFLSLTFEWGFLVSGLTP